MPGVLRLLVGASILPAVRADSTACDVVQRVGLPPSVASAVVRSEQNTKDGPPLSLDPICSQCASGASSADAATCGQPDGAMRVPFNTRSYFLSNEYSSSCEGHPFHHHDYSCVDYARGAIHLAGKVLSYDVDLSAAGCGCNAALYLVSMPQATNSSVCNDYYCDANDVCGERCAELDLMEASRQAWVSTVHVPDDGNGEGYGMAHYVIAKDHRFAPSDGADCAYGPSSACTIDTQKPFSVAIEFSAPPDEFSFSVTLRQEGRVSVASDIKYTTPPTKGYVATAEEANADLRRRLDGGMTLVASYWSTGEKRGMNWLDSPCSASEIEAWGCTDAWVEHADEWPWVCDGDDTSKPVCTDAFTMSNFQLHSPPPPPPPPNTPPPPPTPLTFEEGVEVGFASALLLMGAAAGVWATIASCRRARAAADSTTPPSAAGVGMPLVRMRGFSNDEGDEAFDEDPYDRDDGHLSHGRKISSKSNGAGQDSKEEKPRAESPLVFEYL